MTTNQLYVLKWNSNGHTFHVFFLSVSQSKNRFNNTFIVLQCVIKEEEKLSTNAINKDSQMQHKTKIKFG